MLDLNGAAAARRAGYKRRSNSMASDLLRTPRILEAIEAEKAARAARTQTLADEVIAEIKLLAMARVGDIVEIGADGDPRLDFRKATEGHLAALSSVETETYMEGRGEDARPVKRVKVKYHNKVDALTLLAKHVGLLDKKTEEPVTQINVSFGND